MKKSIITLALIAAAMPAWSRTLSPAEALGRAMQTPGAPVAVTAMQAPASVRAALTVKTATTGQPALYVINRSDEGGFVVVSADHLVTPLLGYSDSGEFDPANMPDNMRWWLSQYSEEIAAAIENGVGEAAEGVSYQAFMRANRKAIPPKLKTKWDQGDPYYNDCPAVGTRRTYTGCVATAMAQILNYHKWPEHGKGTHTYRWDAGSRNLTYDFASATFDWNNMLDTYGSSATATQRAAVANLMYACGVSVDMNYGTSASGAISERVPVGLREYFGFDNGVQMRQRTSYTQEQWETMVYNELNDNGPVYYAGQAPEGGHAFVCDGYENGYFHFNWGWSGVSDGYFLLGALNPEDQGIGGYAGGFNSSQRIVTGLKKPVEGSALPDPTIVVSTPLNAYVSGSTITVTGHYTNGSPFDLKGKVSIRCYKEGTDEYVASLASRSSINLQPAYYTVSMTFSTASLPEGEYRGYPVFTPDGSDEYYPLQLAMSDAGYLNISKVSSVVTATVARRGTLKVNSLEILSPFYVNKVCGVNIDYNYDNEDGLYAEVYPVFVTSSGITMGSGSTLYADFAMGDNVMEYVGTVPDIDKGDYKLGLAINKGLDRNGRGYVTEIISPLYDVTVSSLATNVSTVSVSSDGWSVTDAEKVDPDNLQINVNLRSTYGYFAGNVVARISDVNDASNTPIATLRSQTVFVGNRETKEFSFGGTFTEAEQGKTYNVFLYRGDNGTRLTSTPKTFTVGERSAITDIDADASDLPVEYFNLQGIRVDNPSQGLYIRRQGDKTTKVYVD